MTSIPLEIISQRAHTIWEREGYPEGRDIEHWLQAERELQQESADSAETPMPVSTRSAAKNGAPKAKPTRRPAGTLATVNL